MTSRHQGRKRSVQRRIAAGLAGVGLGVGMMFTTALSANATVPHYTNFCHGNSCAIYKSTDGGHSWTKVANTDYQRTDSQLEC